MFKYNRVHPFLEIVFRKLLELKPRKKLNQLSSSTAVRKICWSCQKWKPKIIVGYN